jgi:hypothetical protein
MLHNYPPSQSQITSFLSLSLAIKASPLWRLPVLLRTLYLTMLAAEAEISPNLSLLQYCSSLHQNSSRSEAVEYLGHNVPASLREVSQLSGGCFATFILSGYSLSLDLVPHAHPHNDADDGHVLPHHLCSWTVWE